MTTKKSRFPRRGMAFLLCGMFVLTGFLLIPGQRALADAPAFVRIIHASPFVGTADVFVDGRSFLTSFAFGTVTDYATIPPGPHKVQIALVGKGINASALTETLAVQPGKVYTVAAIGTNPNNLQLEVFSDNNLAAAGTAKVRIYQLSPNGGWISVQANGTYVTGANYQQASSYFTLSTGSTTFHLNSALTGKSLSLSTTLQVNTVTSIFAVGMFNGDPQAELVSAQTSALPGLPQTGSDPSAPVSDGQLPVPWLLIAMVAVVFGGTLFTRRLFSSR